MGEMKNATITISNFGPINKAKIELKPLNIFIGGHNTGKSYAAQMVYYMARALRIKYLGKGTIGIPEDLEDKVVRKAVREFEGMRRGRVKIKFSEIEKTLQNQGVAWWVYWMELCKREMMSSLKQYFMAADVRDLVRLNDSSVKCGVTFSAVGKNGARVKLVIGKKSGKINVNIETPSIQTLSIGVNRLAGIIDYLDFRIELRGMWRTVWKGVADYESYYLPAARSGILQLWDMVQLYTLENLPEQFGLPSLVRDFLGDVVKSAMPVWGGEEKRKIVKAQEILEDEILRGKIIFVRGRPGPFRIDYEFRDKASIPIQRASSMVAELAPLDLLIRRVLNKGDLLIIEEPEAHLHPSSQIQIARLIARLVNSGIRIICTTHSPLLVNKISNLMLASNVQESVREDIGLKEVDIIKEEDLAVYQFIATDSGSIVKKLRMISTFGIPEDEFLNEYEKISLESYKVSG